MAYHASPTSNLGSPSSCLTRV